MEIIVKELSSEDMEDCISLFIKVFNSDPWNDEWTYIKAKKLFEDFINTPGFTGFTGILKKQLY